MFSPPLAPREFRPVQPSSPAAEPISEGGVFLTGASATVTRTTSFDRISHIILNVEIRCGVGDRIAV